jgi:hypothetical protein
LEFVLHQNKSFFSVMVISNPLWRALLIQVIIFAVIVGVLPSLSFITHLDMGMQGLELAGIQSILAVGLTYLLRLPPWWLIIQAIFPIAIWVGLIQTLIPAWGFGVVTVLLGLVFSNVWRERVPLYLSNAITQSAMAQFAQEKGIQRAVDLGSGLGGIVRALAGVGVEATGVESSPLLVWVSNLLSSGKDNARVIRGDIWQTDLSQMDLVYVFLSPVPMPSIWRKACMEMKSGSWLVSNSFAIPEVEPEEIWELSDGRQTQLWLYRIQRPETMDESDTNPIA